METTVDTPFTVALQDYPDGMPDQHRIAAETRYTRELTRQFGSPEEVAQALDTLYRLEDAPPEEVPPSALTLLKLWNKATNAARQAGFRDLGDAEGAYFEVQLA
jgi:hypothetical protein